MPICRRILPTQAQSSPVSVSDWAWRGSRSSPRRPSSMWRNNESPAPPGAAGPADRPALLQPVRLRPRDRLSVAALTATETFLNKDTTPVHAHKPETVMNTLTSTLDNPSAHATTTDRILHAFLAAWWHGNVVEAAEQ